MRSKRIISHILIAFIAATFFLIYVQYNSAKNISSLINGNEKLLDEYRVNTDLKELAREVVTDESNIRGAVATKDTSHVRKLEAEIAAVQNDLLLLQKISDDDSTIKKVDELDDLVKVKLQWIKGVLDGKSTAEELIASERAKRLTDSILLLAQNIETNRHAILSRLTASNDISGQKAQRFNTILIALMLICGAGLFWYIINIIRKQSSLIVQLNISEKKVKEAAMVKENFMANMSHEIRTPMNAILGFTNLLQRKNLDEESKEYVQTIQKSGEMLLTIINDILDLSKIEAGMMRIESAPFSMHGLLHSFETMFAAKMAE
jgi:signal transduction histidine kinase